MFFRNQNYNLLTKNISNRKYEALKLCFRSPKWMAKFETQYVIRILSLLHKIY